MQNGVFEKSGEWGEAVIFLQLDLEPVVQVNDKTRLSAARTFVAQNAVIEKVEIDPGSGEFLDVTPSDTLDTTRFYLDWMFPSAGEKTVRLRVTSDLVPEGQEISQTLFVVTPDEDKLFSRDQDLVPIEPSLMNYLRPGRASFLDVHREAQSLILSWLDEEGFVDGLGEPFTKAALASQREVREWSKMLALQLIFEGLATKTDDVFSMKAEKYRNLSDARRSRAVLRLDLNGDGEVEPWEAVNISSGKLVRG